MIRVDKLNELYSWLGKMSNDTAANIANSGEVFHAYLGNHLKYHLAEHESFRELGSLREQVKQVFMKKEKVLSAKKEKLFDTNDITRWGFEGP